MRFSGTLEHDGVRAVLRLLGAGGSTGILRLRSPGTKGHLLIRDGRVLQASLDTVSPLGDALVSRGAVARGELDGALSIQRRSRQERPLGRVLVELGLADRDDISLALDDQIRVVVRELLQWREGHYAFEPAADDLDRLPGAGVSIEALLDGKEVAK